MSAGAVAFLKTSVACCSKRDEVFVAAVPLRAPPGPAQLLFRTAYSLDSWGLQHYMVLVKPSSPPPLQFAPVLAFDFQPQDPESVSVAVAVLTGMKIPGVVLERKLEKLPKRKCWRVGYSMGDAVSAAQKFNHNWDTYLRVGKHDCRNYSQDLVEWLTGREFSLENLKNGNYN